MYLQDELSESSVEVAYLLAGVPGQLQRFCPAGPVDGGPDGTGSSWGIIRVSRHSISTGAPANIELSVLQDLC